MVQAFLPQDVKDAARGAGLRVARAVDDSRDAREDDRPRAHRARLERHVEHRVAQPPAAERLRGGTDRDDLGVCGRVPAALSFVVSAGKNLAIVHDDRSDWHVVVFQRKRGLA